MHHHLTTTIKEQDFQLYLNELGKKGLFILDIKTKSVGTLIVDFIVCQTDKRFKYKTFKDGLSYKKLIQLLNSESKQDWYSSNIHISGKDGNDREVEILFYKEI